MLKRLFLGLAFLIGAPGAQAFVVETAGQTGLHPVEAAQRAPRWDAQTGSFLATGERGLGGGLEYAIDESVCRDLVFVDPAPCSAIRAQIAEAARRWSEGHPSLYFTDVSDWVEAELAPPSGGWRGHGAEIDFVATPAPSFASYHVEPVGADAQTFFAFGAPPRGFDGQPIPLAHGRVTAVDIRFNSAVCFYLDPANERSDCLHFGSAALHELSHALGLNHPDEAPYRNLDLDDDPQNAMRLNCGDPLDGLRVNKHVDMLAVSASRLKGAHAWVFGLSPDDLAGRDALYPACEEPEATPTWAAFAVSDSGAYGWARRYDAPEHARERALTECSRQGGECWVAAAFTSCFAFAQASDGRYSWAVRADEALARAGAVANCRSAGGDCAARAAFCAGP